MSDVQMTYWHTVPMKFGTVEEMENEQAEDILSKFK